MPPGLSRRRSAALYLLAWLMLGLVFAALVKSAGVPEWTPALLFAVPVMVIYGVASGFSSYYVCRAYPLTVHRPGAVLSIFFLSSLMAGLVWSGFCAAWLLLVPGMATLPLPPSLTATVFGLGVVLYALTAAAHYLVMELERSRQA
jgi:hypothetical protein